MRFIDVSMELGRGMPSYPGDTPFMRKELRSISMGDDLVLSEITMGSHSGTHVDAPSHFLEEGETVDELPLDAFSGPAKVLDLTVASAAIGREDLASARISGGDIALLKTRNSMSLKEPFRRDYVYLTKEGASSLLEAGVKAVGIDYLSVEGFQAEGFPVHRLLLGAGVGIIEGLDLSRVEAGDYFLLCLPLKVRGGEGSPARAVLVEDWSTN